MGSSKSKAPDNPFEDAQEFFAGRVSAIQRAGLDLFDTADQQRRLNFARGNLGITDPAALSSIQSGGFVPLNSNITGAINTFQGLQGGDPAFGQALSAFGNQSGINALQGIDVGARQNSAESALRNIDIGGLQKDALSSLQGLNLDRLQRNAESTLRGLDFAGLSEERTANQLKAFNVLTQQSNALNDLRNADFSALQNFSPDELRKLTFSDIQGEDPNLAFLRQTGQGQFLTPDANPFLRDAVAAAQNPVLDAFRQQIQPQLAAQFGGGFGVGGSAALNAQRLAAQDVTRSLSDASVQAFAQNFENERARQDAANQFLGQLQLDRSSTLGQLQLGRAQGITDADLSRASTLGQLNLAQAQSLADTRQGFTGLELNRRTGIDQLSAQQAQALAQAQLGQGQALAQSGLGFAGQQLDRATQLGNLGLGFTNARIDRGSALAQSGLGFTNAAINQGSALQSAINQRASGIAGVASARGNQSLAAAQGLLQGGQLQQQNAERAAEIAARQFNAAKNQKLTEAQIIAPLLGSSGGGVTGGPTSNPLLSGLGGGLSGAAAGSVFGVPGAIIGGGIGALGGFLA